MSSSHTAWKVSKYGGFFGSYSPEFGLNTAEYRPEKTPYLDSFHAVLTIRVHWISYLFLLYY